MLAGKMFALVDDVANIDAVREQVIKRAAAAAAPAAMRPAGPALELGAITMGIELVGKRTDRGQLQIALHDVTDDTGFAVVDHQLAVFDIRSEEHTSELQTLMRISYAVFCLKKKTQSK